MADRGRDLKFSILSDLSQLETDDAARGLDKVGDAAQDAGQKLDRLEDDIKGTDLDKFGDDAKDTARKVDDAFDTIARASRASSRKVDDDLDKGKKSLDEFKDEAASTGRESAASFSGGFDDITDAIQETAANAFAGFGPVGAAAGLAAAAGIGFLTSALQKSADEANAVKDRVIELAQEIDDAGGNLDDIDLDGKMRDWSLEIADNKSWWEIWQKSNTTNLEKVRKQADDTGLSFTDLFAGMSGSDPAAAKRVLDEINTALGELDGTAAKYAQTQNLLDAPGTQRYDEERIALESTKQALLDKMGVTEEAIQLAALQAEALGKTRQAEESYAEAIANVVDGSGILAEAVEESAQRQADATKSTEDSWQDYSDTALASIDDVIAKQLEQLSAAQDFNTNMAAVFESLGQEGVDWANSQGENADKAMQLLANAPLAKAQQVVANYRATAAAAGTGYSDALGAKAPSVSAAAAKLHAAAAATLSPVIPIPVRPELRWDPNSVRNEILGGIGSLTVRVGVSSREVIDASRTRP